jgi:hypothetical protein
MVIYISCMCIRIWRLMLFRCSELESPGTILENFSMKYCGTTWSNRVFWTTASCKLNIFKKNLVEIEQSPRFVWGFYEGVLIKKIPRI